MSQHHKQDEDLSESSSRRTQKSPTKTLIQQEGEKHTSTREVVLPPPPSVVLPPPSAQNAPMGSGGGTEGAQNVSMGSGGGDEGPTYTYEPNNEDVFRRDSEMGDSASEDLFLSDEENSQRLIQVSNNSMDEVGLEELQEFQIQNPFPLSCLFPDQSNASDWVFKTVKDIQEIVGLKCEGYEEQFMALLTAIEAGHQQQKKIGSKKQRELRRLTWSLNSEGSSSRERTKGKGLALPK